MDNRSRILVVDDEELNRSLMEAMLIPLGYNVILAKNGEEALEKVSEVSPDVILLDIMMPNMDGYEVARRLKDDDDAKIIPIVMVTALKDVQDRIRALEAGADDFLSKPIDRTELQARVRSLIKVKAYHDHMRQYQQTLEKQNEVLRENARLKEDIEQITRHDLKAPLNGIINLPAIILSEGNLSEKQKKCLQMIIQAGKKMLNMINRSLDLYKMEQGVYQFQPASINVLPIIKEILDEKSDMLNSKNMSPKIILNGKPVKDGDEFILSGDHLLFYSMLSNIIINAIEASPKEESIVVSLENDGAVKIKIHNMGAVPADIRDSFFDKYTTSGKRHGTGLGTYSARLAAEAQGGSIGLETSEDLGTEDYFSF